jgi:hypothetical protein
MLSTVKRVLNTVYICGVCVVFPSFLIHATEPNPVGASTSPTTPLACHSLSGKVRLDPDASCKIATLYQGPTYLGLMNVPNTCFSLQTTAGGTAVVGEGYAGLTTEKMVAPNGGAVQTPTMLQEGGVPSISNEFGSSETRRIFTGRSAISLPGGTIYTADVGALGLGASAEQLIVTGGDGIYKNAQGIFYARGQYIAQWGNYDGDLCHSPSTYEAEAAGNQLSGSTFAADCGPCSGDAKVRFIGRDSSNFVTINNVYSSSSSNRQLTIYSIVNGTRSFYVSVNGGAGIPVPVTGSSWSTFVATSITVPLNVGKNSIKFYNDSEPTPDLDRIVVY